MIKHNTCEIDGCNYRVWARNRCKFHDTKKPVPIPKMTEKKKAEITQDALYYKKAIGENIIKNGGKCRCDECGHEIKMPRGANCCHIVGKGADLTLYHHPLNHFVLGKGEIFGECNCAATFDDKGEKHTMKIYPRFLEIREKIKSGG